MERLVEAVSDLSLARDELTVREIVRTTARQLTGADGAALIMREGEHCYYVDEDAIGPLWKGQRFPMSACISGWAMQHKSPVILEDIYSDPRIPLAAYLPTFVKSLVMVPIRTVEPIGAIGNYWATQHAAEAYEVRLLQALADSTSIALEHVRAHQELETRVRERTEQLEAANVELEAFSFSASHDLRAPLRAIRGFSSMLQDHCADLQDQDRHCVRQILKAAERMDRLIHDLLELSRASRAPLTRECVNLSAMVAEIVTELRARTPDRTVHVGIASNMVARCDAGPIRIALENLLENAWKFTSHQEQPKIEFGALGARRVYFVRDNGAGFDMARAGRLFSPFQRLHTECEFPGTGIGLATVKRVIHRHGGSVFAESALGSGATCFFTLGEAS